MKVVVIQQFINWIICLFCLITFRNICTWVFLKPLFCNFIQVLFLVNALFLTSSIFSFKQQNFYLITLFEYFLHHCLWTTFCRFRKFLARLKTKFTIFVKRNLQPLEYSLLRKSEINIQPFFTKIKAPPFFRHVFSNSIRLPRTIKRSESFDVFRASFITKWTS